MYLLSFIFVYVFVFLLYVFILLNMLFTNKNHYHVIHNIVKNYRTVNITTGNHDKFLGSNRRM
jgi:hypothetical protein